MHKNCWIEVRKCETFSTYQPRRVYYNKNCEITYSKNNFLNKVTQSFYEEYAKHIPHKN